MRRLLVGAVVLASAATAAARGDPWYLVLSDVNAECMRVSEPSAPAFPSGAKDDEGGVVRARLTFPSADAPPTVELFTNTAGDAFGAVIRSHVATYRVRCPDPGGRPVVLTQEFQFVPNANRLVLRGGYFRSASIAEKSIEGCTRESAPTPDYPSFRLRNRNESENGGAVVQVRFLGPDRTEAKLMTEGGGRLFEQMAVEHAGQYRLKCADPAIYPVTATVPYFFRMEGSPRYEFRPSSLKDFLGATDSIESERVRFDFHTMGCPFKVHYQNWPPPYGGRARSDGAFADERREFLAWLSGLRLKTSSTRMRQDLTGQTLAIDIPCLTLNLL